MSIRILIADPDEYLLGVYREHLEQHGFDVVTATNGLDCVSRLRDSAVDLLVLEPVLPWGGGDGVLTLMREEPSIPLTPVIVLSCRSDRGMLYRLSSFRIEDFQTKPMSPECLEKRIRTLLDGQPRQERSPLRHRMRLESRA